MTQKEIEQTKIEAPYELPEGWKWIPLLESFENKTSSNKKLPTKDYSDAGKYAIIDQGQEFIGGYSDKTDFVFDGELPIIIFGDHTKCIKYIDFPFIQGADGVKILKPISIVDSKYFYYALQNIHFPDLGYRRHFPIFKDYQFPLPPTLAEQQRIVNRIETMFAKLDEAKDKAQSVVDSFETRKAAILHKAFTGELTANWRKKNGVPDDSWEEKTIGELYVINPKIKADDDIAASFIPMEKIEANAVNRFSFEVKPWGSIKKNHTQFQDGDVCFAKISPCFENGKAFIAEGLENGIGAGTTELIILRNADVDTHFTFYLVTDLSFVHGGCATYSGTVGQQRINMDYVRNYKVSLPSLPEQQEIVLILDTVLEKESHAKEAAQTVLDQIALLKKSILARAFRGEL